MIQVAAFTVFALLLARLVGAPRGAWRWILFAATVVLAGSQLLPAGNAFREDVRGSASTLGWLALAAVPVAAYGLVIRAIRRRTGADAALAAGQTPPQARPGLVLIPEDAALVRDTEAALASETGASPERFSLAWRGEDGAVAGHARLRLGDGLADLELLWVAPGARGRGIGALLVGQAADEARRRGATCLAAATADPAAARWLARHGFAAYGALAPSGAPARQLLVRNLA